MKRSTGVATRSRLCPEMCCWLSVLCSSGSFSGSAVQAAAASAASTADSQRLSQPPLLWPRATPPDPTGSRAMELQRVVSAACTSKSSAKVPLFGVYNFSAEQFRLTGCEGVTLEGSGADTTVLVFQGASRNATPPSPPTLVHGAGGVNEMLEGVR